MVGVWVMVFSNYRICLEQIIYYMAMERGCAIMLTNEKIAYGYLEEFTKGDSENDGYFKLNNDHFLYFTKLKHSNGYRM